MNTRIGPQPNFRGSSYDISLRFLLAVVIFLTPLQGILARSSPPFDARAQSDLGFIAGNWKVKYTDRVLGEVTGYAVVERPQPGETPLVRYTIEDPRTKQRYEMVALDVSLDRDILEMRFFGASPSGAAGGELPTAVTASAPIVIEAPRGSKITASVGDVKAEATFGNAAPVSVPAPAVQSSLLLRFPVGRAVGAQDRLDGQWLVRRHWQKGFDGLRAGEAATDKEWKAAFEDAAEVMRGSEIWERNGPQIDSVAFAETAPFGRYAIVDPSFYREREFLVPPAWLRIEGTELPVKPGERVEVSFDDPAIKYTGRHRPDPRVAGALQVEVDLNKNISPGLKTLTLNGSAGVWEFDFPGLEPKEIRYVRRVRDNEYEPTGALYLGEAFFVEVEFPYLPFYNERKFVTAAETPVTYTVRKDPRRPRVFRSQPLLLMERDDAPPTEKELFDTENPTSRVQHLIVRAWEGAVLATTAADAVVRGSKPKAALAEVLDALEGRYQQALAQAKAIRREYPDPENYRFSIVAVSELRRRNTAITVQDHAALILIHEELQNRVERAAADLRSNLPVTLAQGHPSIAGYWVGAKAQMVQAIIRAAATNKDAPLFQFKVAAPGQRREIPLGEALSSATKSSLTGTQEQKEQKFLEYATWAVIDAERQLSSRMFEAVSKMANADIRKPNELLLFARLGYDAIAPPLMQRLVRPSDTAAGEPFYPRWVPDRAGMAAVRGIADLITAIQSEEAYSSTEKFLLSVGLSLFVAAIGGVVALAAAVGRSAAVATLALAGVALDVVDFGIDIGMAVHDLDRSYKLGADANIALGTSPVTGVGAYQSIKAEADAAMFSAALAGAVKVGSKVFQEAVRLGMKPSRAAMENALFFAEKRGVNGLSKSNRDSFEYLRGLAEYRAAHFGADALNDLEKRALRASYPNGLPESVATTLKVRPGDTTLPPVYKPDPSLPKFDPRAETVSSPRLPPNVESTLPELSKSGGSGTYRIDLRDAAPELSTNPSIRRIYNQGEAAARSGDAAALSRQRRLEYAEREWQSLTPAQKGRVEDAWRTFEKLRASNPKLASVNEADAMSLLMVQTRRQQPQPDLPGTANLPSRPVDAEEMAAIVAEWHKVPVTAQDLARAANVSVANAEASLKGARNAVDRYRGGSGGADLPKLSTTTNSPGSGDTSLKIDERARVIAKRLAEMGVPTEEAWRGAIVPASRNLDVDTASAGAAWRRDVPPRVVMERLGVDRERLKAMLDKYLRSVFQDPPAKRAEIIDRYLNSETRPLTSGTGPSTSGPTAGSSPGTQPPGPLVAGPATEVFPSVSFPPLRIEKPVPGLYDSITTSRTPLQGWTFNDATELYQGVNRIQTRVTTPSGREGTVSRGYDPRKKQIIMYGAYLDDFQDTPERFIQAGTPLIAGQGTPTITYATLRQLKLLGMKYAAARSLKMVNIQNIDAIMQLNSLMKKHGIPPNRAVLQTHSMHYAETILSQSGHEIVPGSARVVFNARPTNTLANILAAELDDLADEAAIRAIKGRHDAMLRQYGLTREDRVIAYFDIEIDVRPIRP